MNIGEMGHVQEAFHLASGRSGDIEAGGQDVDEIGVLPSREIRNILLAAADTGPDQAIALDGRIHNQL
ncbi:hypothetical protein D3C71_1836530 [compost metagenome]